MTSEYNILLNPNKSKVVDTGFTFSQGDKGITLRITVEDMDVANTSVQIGFRKPSGSVEATGLTASGNVYTYVIRGTELDTPGKVIADLKFKESTTKRISTASFMFQVVTDTLDGMSKEAGSYSDSIAQMRQQIVQEAKADLAPVQYVPQVLTAAQKAQALNNLGIPDTGLTYKDTVATTAQLPSSAAKGDWYIVSANGHAYVWNGNSWGDAGTAFNVNELKQDLSQLTKPNLLDNPWFTVNQRDTTSYTVGAYGVDRWKLISGTASVTANGIVLNGTLRQIRETALGTSQFIASVKCLSGSATVSYNDSTKYFDITSSGGTIRAVKLETGSYSTLARDINPDYGEELRKCQRYFVRWKMSPIMNINIPLLGVATNNTAIAFAIPLPVQMVDSNNVGTIVNNNTIVRTLNNTNVTVTSWEITTMAPGMAFVIAYTSGGLSTGTLYKLRHEQNSYLDISRDL